MIETLFTSEMSYIILDFHFSKEQQILKFLET